MILFAAHHATVLILGTRNNSQEDYSTEKQHQSSRINAEAPEFIACHP